MEGHSSRLSDTPPKARIAFACVCACAYVCVYAYVYAYTHTHTRACEVRSLRRAKSQAPASSDILFFLRQVILIVSLAFTPPAWSSDPSSLDPSAVQSDDPPAGSKSDPSQAGVCVRTQCSYPPERNRQAFLHLLIPPCKIEVRSFARLCAYATPLSPPRQKKVLQNACNAVLRGLL